MAGPISRYKRRCVAGLQWIHACYKRTGQLEMSIVGCMIRAAGAVLSAEIACHKGEWVRKCVARLRAGVTICCHKVVGGVSRAWMPALCLAVGCVIGRGLLARSRGACTLERTPTLTHLSPNVRVQRLVGVCLGGVVGPLPGAGLRLYAAGGGWPLRGARTTYNRQCPSLDTEMVKSHT